MNGLISLNRPKCFEAAAGKNPVSHVGKIYNLLTHGIASEIYSRVQGVEEAYVWMPSKIDQPGYNRCTIDHEPDMMFDSIKGTMIFQNCHCLIERRKNVHEMSGKWSMICLKNAAKSTIKMKAKRSGRRKTGCQRT